MPFSSIIKDIFFVSMIQDYYILPTIFRLMQGQTLSIDECKHDFFKQAINEGILSVNKSNHTLKAKIHKEERYYYTRDRYGHSLLNLMCSYFNDHEGNILIKYWEQFHTPITSRDQMPNIELNPYDENSITLLGKVHFIQESSLSETTGTVLSIETKTKYTNLAGDICEDWIYTHCIVPGKGIGDIKNAIQEKSIVLIKGFFRPERGKYKFFFENEADVIVKEYALIGTTTDLEPENGDENFFIDRSETDSSKYLNKVVLTGRISNIGFQLTRGYPHITLHLRTRINDEGGYVEIPIEIWEKHHKDCFKDINIGESIWIEGYFKHPIRKKYYYCYESIDATVFAYKYKVLSQKNYKELYASLPTRSAI